MDELLKQARNALRAMWKRRWIGVAAAWITAVVAGVAVQLLPERYESKARVYVDTQTIIKPLMSGLAVQPDVDQMVTMVARTMVTRPHVERLFTEVGLDREHPNPAAREAAIELLMKQIRLERGGRENLYTISYRDTDPARAQLMVEKLVALFVQTGVGGKLRDTAEAGEFIESQIREYEDKLNEAENRVKEFKLKNFGLAGGNQDHLARMQSISEDLDKVRTDLRAAEQSRDALRKQLTSEDALVGTEPSAALVELDQRIDAQRKQLDDLLRRYTEDHPDVSSTRRLLAQLEGQRRTEQARSASGARGASNNPVYQKIRIALADGEANVASLRARYSELAGRLETMRRSAKQMPKVEAEMAALNRDYDVLRKNYEQLVQQREKVSLAGAVDKRTRLDEFRVIDPPRTTSSPVFPNRQLTIPLALLLALGVGVVVAYVWTQLYPTVLDAATLRALSRRPVLGGVSVVPSAAGAAGLVSGSNLRFGAAVGALVVVFAAWLAALAALRDVAAP